MQLDYKKYTWLAGSLALIAFAFAAVASGMNDFRLAKHPNGQLASISVTGEGEVTAIPDIATITFTVKESAKTVPEAQKLVEGKISQAFKEMSSLSIDKKDIKTTSYTINPKYEQQAVASYCMGYNCPPLKTVVIGYEVAESVQVKVRKIEQSGNIVGILGKANITEVSGPEFSVDDMEKIQAEAKALAIAKAQEKAKATAKSLHTRLGEIIQFTEEGANPYPVMYRTEVMSMKVADGASQAVVPSLPQGESVIKSRVVIVYSLE